MQPLRTLARLAGVLSLAVAGLALEAGMTVHLGSGERITLPPGSVECLTLAGARGPRIQRECLPEWPADTVMPLGARVSDPEGVAWVVAQVSLGGGPELAIPLTPAGEGLWSTTLPALPAGVELTTCLLAGDGSPEGQTNRSPDCRTWITTLAAPRVEIHRLEGNLVRLAWTAVPGANRYRLYGRSPLEAGESLLLETGATEALLSAPADTTRLLRVRAVN